MKKPSFLLVLSLVAFMAGSVPCHAADVLSQDFEGLTLGPFVSSTESGGDGTDWTDQLPAGWNMTFEGPIGSPVEFQGWRVMDVDSWIATEGNQERATWTRGGVGARGSVLVTDPDAYDDGTNIDTGLFNAWITTPAVDLSSVPANTVKIAFDSFWRNEETQIGKLDVSFDGGASYANLLTYDSAALADGLVVDERPEILVNNPASGSLVFRFGMTQASNDWWWAIDDVQVSVVPEPASASLLMVGLMLGVSSLRRRRK